MHDCLSFTVYRLVEEHPSVRPILAKVKIDDPKSPEFQAHALRVITGLDLCVNALQNYQTLESITDHLAMQHEARTGVTVEYFNVSHLVHMLLVKVNLHGK